MSARSRCMQLLQHVDRTSGDTAGSYQQMLPRIVELGCKRFFELLGQCQLTDLSLHRNSKFKAQLAKDDAAAFFHLPSAEHRKICSAFGLSGRAGPQLAEPVLSTALYIEGLTELLKQLPECNVEEIAASCGLPGAISNGPRPHVIDYIVTVTFPQQAMPDYLALLTRGLKRQRDDDSSPSQ